MSSKLARPASAQPRTSAPQSAQNAKPAPSRARPASAVLGAAGSRAAARATTTRPPRGTSASGSRQLPPTSSPADAEAKPGSEQSDTTFFQEQVYRLQREHQALKEMQAEETAQYRRQLRRFYNGNAVLRNIIASAERRARHDGETDVDAPASVTEAEVQHLQYRINLARRRQNRLLHDLKVASALVEGEKAAEAEAIQSVQLTEAEVAANRPAFLRKHRLERRLNEILNQQRTINVVMKGYAHHMDELHTEGLHYDAQMQTVEKELRDRDRDLSQLVTLFRNAKKEYQAVAHECVEFSRRFEAGRTAKDQALSEKRELVDRQLSSTREQANRLVVLEQQLEEEAQLMESAENIEAELAAQRLGGRTAMVVLTGGRHSASAQRGQATVQEEEKLSAYEKLFRTLMEQAKVSEPEELVAVFEAELRAQVQMIDEVESRRAACAQLREEVQSLRAKVDDARLCGLPRQPTATPALEAELDKFTREEQARLMNAVQHQQETETTLAELVRRINALAHLTSGYRSDVSIPDVSASGDATFLLHTAVLAQKVLALADDTVQTHRRGNEAGTVADAPHPVRSTQLIVPANNVRIPLAGQDCNAARRREGGAKLVGSLRRGSSQHGAPAAATVSSKAGARLLEMRRASQEGARLSMGSLSFASGAAANGFSESYGLFPDSTAAASHAHELSGSESSDGERLDEADVAPSPLASTAAPRRSATATSRATHKNVVTADAGVSEDDPLRRDEIKKMSEALLQRQKKREAQEQRRQAGRGM